MAALLYAWRTLARDWKSGELGVLAAAVTVAVAALTAIAFFTDRVGQGVAAQATEVLAADLRVQAPDRPDEEHLREAGARGLATATTLAFPSVVLHGDQSQLAGIRAVSADYPLRGSVRVSDRLFGESRVIDRAPAPGEVWAESALLARLGVDTGAEVNVGETRLTVTRVLDYRPDQSVGFVSLAPTLLMNLDDIPATGLVAPGSRVTWAYLFAGTPAEIDRFADWLRPRLADGERLEDVGDSGEQITAAIDRAQRFLTLASLVAVLLAAVAVAMAARRYAARHTDTVALLKCLGARQRFVMQVMVVQLATLALATGALGSLLGWLAQFGIARLLAGVVGVDLPPAGLLPALMGMVTAVAVLTGFALPQVAALRTVSPLRVLRRDLPPPRATALVATLSAVAVVLLTLWWIARDALLLTVLAVGIAGALAVLALTGWLLVQLTTRLRRGAGVAWRYGLANIGRRGGDSVTQVVAFGLGVMVLLLLAVVRNDLLDAWRASLPENAPNNFVINIQPHELDGVRELFAEFDHDPPVLSPLVRARITAVNDQRAGRLRDVSPDGRRFLDREANLSYASDLPPSNRIVQGRWWGDDPDGVEVSLEDGVAESLGVSVGDRLTFAVAGEEVTGRITSLRAVAWDSFDPNFFVMLSPGSLDEFPTTWITSAWVPPEDRALLLELVRRFPGVSVIDLESVIAQVRTVMDRAALAVQYVFAFTLLAGVVVLLAAVQATRDERRYESALLRTFGARRGVVLTGVLAEFVTLGLLAGVLASAGAVIVGQVLATRVFSLEYTPDPLVLLGGPLLGAALVGLAGLAATYRVIRTPPLHTLRA